LFPFEFCPFLVVEQDLKKFNLVPQQEMDEIQTETRTIVFYFSILMYLTLISSLASLKTVALFKHGVQ